MLFAIFIHGDTKCLFISINNNKSNLNGKEIMRQEENFDNSIAPQLSDEDKGKIKDFFNPRYNLDLLVEEILIVFDNFKGREHLLEFILHHSDTEGLVSRERVPSVDTTDPATLVDDFVWSRFSGMSLEENMTDAHKEVIGHKVTYLGILEEKLLFSNNSNEDVYQVYEEEKFLLIDGRIEKVFVQSTSKAVVKSIFKDIA